MTYFQGTVDKTSFYHTYVYHARFNLVLSEIESAGLRISELLLNEVRGQMKYDFTS